MPVNAIVKNIKDLEGAPVRTTDSGAVFLRDVATVEDTADLVTSYALVNGRRTVYIPVTKRADASTLSVVNLVKKSLARFQSVLPDDVKVSYEFDQSPVVLHAIKDLTKEGLFGAILTGVMVLLFLRDWRSALIVVLNIPISLAAAILALWLTGQSIHLMTLGGLALAIGILVDEATVTIENIHTHLAGGARLARAARDATVETVGPRLLAMLCILAVFIPAATGGSAGSSAAIVTIMDFETVRLQVAVPEMEASLVQTGQPAKFAVEGLSGRTFSGQVSRHSYALDDASKTLLVEADVPNPQRELRPGMYAMVKLGVEKHLDALLIPVEAVVMEKINAFAYVVTDGRARKKAMKIGFNDGSRIEVLEGLKGDESVILVGKMVLTDGAAVKTVETP